MSFMADIFEFINDFKFPLFFEQLNSVICETPQYVATRPLFITGPLCRIGLGLEEEDCWTEKSSYSGPGPYLPAYPIYSRKKSI